MTALAALPMPLPTPFGVGEVNTYLIDDDPLTLVDTGPNSAQALVALSDALAARGVRIADLERIVLTHQHLDHIGLAGILAERSGAEVCALAELAPWLAAYEQRMDAEDAFIERLMLRHGVPDALARGLHAVAGERRAWGGAVEVTHPLRDGDVLDFAHRAWRVHHRPGHSPSDTVFHDEDSGEAFSGDHLLAHISSNAVVTPPLAGDDAGTELEPHALRTYIGSLRATSTLDARVLHPGHGEAIQDHRGLIARRLLDQERRAEQIAGLLRERPLTAFEIAEGMWGETALAQPYLVVSEVLGHVDLLVEAGRVRARHEGTVTRFETRSWERP